MATRVKNRVSILYGGNLREHRTDADAVRAALVLAESGIYGGTDPLTALYQIATVLNTPTTVRKA